MGQAREISELSTQVAEYARALAVAQRYQEDLAAKEQVVEALEEERGFLKREIEAAREARGRFRRLDAFRCGERDDENLKICARAAARRDGAFQTYASFD